jgi:formate-dependent nitrite reductase membrane component NrfD
MSTISGIYTIFLFITAIGLLVKPEKFAVFAFAYNREETIICNLGFSFFYIIVLVFQVLYLRIVLKALRYLRNVLLNPASDLPRV